MTFQDKLFNILSEGKGTTYDFELCQFSKELFSLRSQIPKLYRYSRADYNNIRGLEKRTIFLSEAGQMNDMFEGLSVYIDNTTREELSELHDLVYLKAFSESFNNLLMWGQYADNYAGMCVEYDLREMNAHEDYYWHLFPVCYRAERFAGLTHAHYIVDSLKQYRKEPTLEDADFLRDVLSFYLVKSEAWKSEKEWRFIVPNFYMNEEWDEGGVIDEDESPNLYSINSQTIDFPYISKVYMGARIPKLQKEHIIEICKEGRIPVYETRPSLTQYQIECNEI